MPRIDFSTILRDLDGKPIERTPAKTVVGDNGTRTEVPAESATLKHACVDSLLAELQSDGTSVGAEERLRRFTLAARINGATSPLDLKADHIVLLKKRIEQCCPTLILGRCYEILDPEPDGDQAAPILREG